MDLTFGVPRSRQGGMWAEFFHLRLPDFDRSPSAARETFPCISPDWERGMGGGVSFFILPYHARRGPMETGNDLFPARE